MKPSLKSAEQSWAGCACSTNIHVPPLFSFNALSSLLQSPLFSRSLGSQAHLRGNRLQTRSCYSVVHSSMGQGQFFTLFFIFFFVNNGDGEHNLMEANGSKEGSEKGKLLPRPLFPVSFWGNLQRLGERTGFLITVTIGSWGWHSMIIFQEYYILCSYWKHSHFPTPFLTHPYKIIQSF